MSLDKLNRDPAFGRLSVAENSHKDMPSTEITPEILNAEIEIFIAGILNAMNPIALRNLGEDNERLRITEMLNRIPLHIFKTLKANLGDTAFDSYVNIAEHLLRNDISLVGDKIESKTRHIETQRRYPIEQDPNLNLEEL